MDAQTAARELWGAWLLRGIALVLFGIAAVFWPKETIVIFIYLFSALILISGVVSIVHGISEVSKGNSWFLTVLIGVVEAGVGVYLLRHPKVTFTTLILLIGFVLIIRGIAEIVNAFLEQGRASDLTLRAFGGFLALVVGVIMLFQKQSAGIAFVWIIGLYAILAGCLQIGMAIEAKRFLNEE